MIALDTSAIICLVQLIEPAHGRLDALVAAHDDRAVVSAAAVAECYVRPIVDKNHSLVTDFDSFFISTGVLVVPVSEPIARQAASLAARFKLKPLDAIHLATAIDAGADAFATTDHKDFSACAGHVPLTIELVVRYSHQQPPP